MNKHLKVVIFYIILIIIVIIIRKQSNQIKQSEKQLRNNRNEIKELVEKLENLNKRTIHSRGFSDYDFQTVEKLMESGGDGNENDIYEFEIMSLDSNEKSIPFIQSYDIGKNSFINSLFGGAIHVLIRPDDIWVLIIKQISTYLKYHKDNQFNWGGAFSVTNNGSGINNQVLEHEFERVLGASSFSNISNVIKPSFSTTLPNDNIAIQTMFLCKNKFRFKNELFLFDTSIPNIRILGLKKDYKLVWEKLESIVTQIESNLNYSPLRNWMNNMIKPILKEFIEITPESSHTGFRDNIIISKSTQSIFWKRILDFNEDHVSSVDTIDGWISSFFYFTDFGTTLTPVSSSIAFASHFKLSGKHLSNNYCVVDVKTLDDNEKVNDDQWYLFGGHISVDIIENYKFIPRLDWVLKKMVKKIDPFLCG